MEVFNITAAQPGTTSDQRMRQNRYLFGMAVRTLCFVVAILVPGFWRWVAVTGAVFLPYLAVVGANAGRERVEEAPNYLTQLEITDGQ